MDQFYVAHFIWQSCGWVKVGEYACKDEQDVLNKKLEVLAAHPHDGNCFETRRHGSAA